jgi:hypothetical protein
VGNIVWEIRERIAIWLVWLAHKIDDGVALDIYRGRECQDICLKVWNGELEGQKLKEAIYIAMY